MKKLLAFAVVILGFAAVSFGQAPVSATANASATIIGPITITKTSDLEFGNLAVNAATAGTATLTAAATPVLSSTGGVVPVAGVTPTSAQFTVTGVATYGYSISSPANINLSDGASHTIKLDLTPLPTTSVIPSGGKEYFVIGGSLTVAGDQASGIYTNTSELKVTVNYN